MLISRFTTRYSGLEDRICLTGERSAGPAVALWLTKRLLDRLLPHAFGWLERQTPAPATPRRAATVGAATVLQQFAQQAAVATLRPEPPVARPAGSDKLLVRSIDVQPSPGGLLLRFNPEGEQRDDLPELRMTATQLRQWLSILHGQYHKAGWSFALWPEWISEARRSLRAGQDQRLH